MLDQMKKYVSLPVFRDVKNSHLILIVNGGLKKTQWKALVDWDVVQLLAAQNILKKWFILYNCDNFSKCNQESLS